MQLQLQPHTIELILFHERHHFGRVDFPEHRTEINMAALSQLIFFRHFQSAPEIILTAGNKLDGIIPIQISKIAAVHRLLHAALGKLVVHRKDRPVFRLRQISDKHTSVCFNLNAESVLDQKRNQFSDIRLQQRLTACQRDVAYTCPTCPSQQFIRCFFGIRRVCLIRPFRVAIGAAEIAALEADERRQLSRADALAVDAHELFHNLIHITPHIPRNCPVFHTPSHS